MCLRHIPFKTVSSKLQVPFRSTSLSLSMRVRWFLFSPGSMKNSDKKTEAAGRSFGSRASRGKVAVGKKMGPSDLYGGQEVTI